MGARLIQFGWGAQSFASQLPQLPKQDAEAADADNRAIIRLSARGILTEAERDRAIKRATSRIERALAQVIKAEGRDREWLGAKHESTVAEGDAP